MWPITLSCPIGNMLKGLPDEIGKMKSLRTLNISHNNVTNLPVPLANVRTMEVFW